MKGYPRPFRRDLRVSAVEELPGGILMFTVQSYGEDAAEHYTCVDTEVGLVDCSCPGYQMVRGALADALGHWPTLLTPHYQCKHITHLVAVLWLNGRLRGLALRRALWFERMYGSLPEPLAQRTCKALAPDAGSERPD